MGQWGPPPPPETCWCNLTSEEASWPSARCAVGYIAVGPGGWRGPDSAYSYALASAAAARRRAPPRHILAARLSYQSSHGRSSHAIQIFMIYSLPKFRYLFSVRKIETYIFLLVVSNRSHAVRGTCT